MNKHLVDLTNEYMAWLDHNNLPQMSADELVHEDGLSAEQRKWLGEFTRRWDDIERSLRR